MAPTAGPGRPEEAAVLGEDDEALAVASGQLLAGEAVHHRNYGPGRPALGADAQALAVPPLSEAPQRAAAALWHPSAALRTGLPALRKPRPSRHRHAAGGPGSQKRAAPPRLCGACGGLPGQRLTKDLHEARSPDGLGSRDLRRDARRDRQERPRVAEAQAGQRREELGVQVLPGHALPRHALPRGLGQHRNCEGSRRALRVVGRQAGLEVEGQPLGHADAAQVAVCSLPHVEREALQLHAELADRCMRSKELPQLRNRRGNSPMVCRELAVMDGGFRLQGVPALREADARQRCCPIRAACHRQHEATIAAHRAPRRPPPPPAPGSGAT
mmetsp:Transcript_86014/g.256586  ORF Transcript_86014/g.256586 Transcript_86014/m.256586 type:complete len:329 (+) Transcript_86014:259-1245(+)